VFTVDRWRCLGSAKITDSPLLREQIQVLQTALRVKSTQCSRLTGEKMIEDLKVKAMTNGTNISFAYV